MCKAHRFDGIVVPMITPLTPDHEVDRPSVRRLVDFIIGGGCHGLWVLGATGQFHTLTERQRDQMVETAIEAAGGRVPVLVGCMDTGPDRAIDSARRALSFGADAIFATAPIFDAITQAEVLANFRRIRQAVDLPLVAYNAEYATQTPFTLDTVCTLVEEGTLAGIKDSADFAAFRRVVCALRDRPTFTMLTGHAFLADAAVLMGAHGAVPTYANIVPATYAALYEAARKGDWVRASALQNEAVQAARLLDAWGPDSVFGAFLGAAKTALHQAGVLASPLSGAPYREATAAQRERIGATLKELGILAAPTASRDAL